MLFLLHPVTTCLMSITPLEQFANPLLFLPFPILHIGITKLTLYGLFALIITIGLFVLPIFNKVSFVGTRWTMLTETIYTSVSSILKDQIGDGFSEYLPSAISIFTFILVANLVSNVPYSFGFTTSVIVCLGLSVTIFIGVTIIGLKTHGIVWFSFFVPDNCPLGLVPVLVLIEFISYIARAFSLGVRLLANIVSGHILLVVLSSMLWSVATKSILLSVVSILPFALFTGLFALELAVSVIQSYVFCLLFCSYLNDAINLH